ncbi:MAG: YlxR family protein [Clostridia bacterium]|nr:YlxR family protein [Clostridia bacterium]
MAKPLRMCIGCRGMKDKDLLLRFALSNDEVVFDKAQKIQSRGAYICNSEDCIKLAKKKNALSRHFKRKVPDSIYEIEE